MRGRRDQERTQTALHGGARTDGAGRGRPARRQRRVEAVAEIDVREIMMILPHRYPLLLIDRILELEPLKYARGYKNITANEPVFQGHFPGNPLLPGIYMVEAL